MDSCPRGHSLEYHDGTNHKCDVCRCSLGKSSQYYCQSCNWDYCDKCYAKCSGRHPLSAKDRNNANCDVCRNNVGTFSNHCCEECNYDICDVCYDNSNLGSL